MAKPRLRAKLVLLGIALFIPVLLITLAEGITRLFSPHLDPLAVFVTSPQLRSDTQGETTSGMFEFDPLLTWRLRANLRNFWWDFTPVTTNSTHLRMDRELFTKRGLRIVTLGDSVTFGYRVPVAANKDKPSEFDAAEKCYPKLLEEMLQRDFPGRQIEVIPLACPGYTSGQGLAWLKRDIRELRPDIVTACFGWNDVRAAGAADRDTMPGTPSQVRIRSLIGHSQLLLQMTQSARSKTAPLITKPEPRSSPEEYVANFSEMASVSRSNGAWFGVLLPVYRDANTDNLAEGNRMTQYRDQLRASAETKHIPALEIPELTERSSSTNGGMFGERIHPNAAGHRLMAQRVLEFISPAVAERTR